MLYFHTTVDPTFLKKKLWIGSFLAGCGVFLLTFGGVFLKPHLLEQYGLVIFFGAFFLIALGFVPYKKLQKLETIPNTLKFDHENRCIFSVGDKPKWIIPVHQITDVRFEKTFWSYGITLDVKNKKAPHKIHHFYFPYFSERTAVEIKSLIEECHAS